MAAGVRQTRSSPSPARAGQGKHDLAAVRGVFIQRKELKIYQVDAFAGAPFTGNPAAVCLLEEWLPDRLLQNIAAENNLSETAFLVGNDSGYEL